MKGERSIRCPRCRGLGSCAECDGLGEVACHVCDGLGDGCEQCLGEGKYICVTCDGSGQCPRCRGEGEIEVDESPPASLHPWI